MILEYLEKMRERSPQARRRFILIVAASVSAIIAGIWVVTIPMRFSLSELWVVGDAGSESLSDLSEMSDGSRTDLQQLVDMKETVPTFAGEALEDAAAAIGAFEDLSTTEESPSEAASSSPQTIPRFTPAPTSSSMEAAPPAKKTIIIATSSSGVQ